jgi:RNA polymerase sigma factor (TIGR02999 family)
MAGEPGEITLLLRKVGQGQSEASEELIRGVYHDLRRIAQAFIRDERPGHTLQPTALIHEAWIRLAAQTRVEWRDRAHFFGVAAEMMRRVLVDYARARLTGKRGSGSAPMSLDWVQIESDPPKLEEILAVDCALSKLDQLDLQQARIVRMHYFAGMTVQETADALGISCRTVNREWAMASAWLRRELSERGAQ